MRVVHVGFAKYFFAQNLTGWLAVLRDLLNTSMLKLCFAAPTVIKKQLSLSCAVASKHCQLPEGLGM